MTDELEGYRDELLGELKTVEAAIEAAADGDATARLAKDLEELNEANAALERQLDEVRSTLLLARTELETLREETTRVGSYARELAQKKEHSGREAK